MSAVRFDFRVEKASPSGRFVSGWLSVVEKDGKPVEDTQGDRIAIEEIAKAFRGYMKGSRVIKARHAGAQVGEMVECIVIDNDFAKAHGIAHTTRGVWGTAEITDDEARKEVRTGVLKAFSIGGRGKRVAIEKAAGLLLRGGSGPTRRALLTRSILLNRAILRGKAATPSSAARRLGAAQNYLGRRSFRKASPDSGDVHATGLIGSTKKPMGGGRVRFTLSRRAKLIRRALAR
jgi:Putative phage serine protease XkdF